MPSDRLFGAYMFMAGLILLATFVAISVTGFVRLGWTALAIFIPSLLLLLPILVFLLWEAIHIAWHDNTLWDQYPGNNKQGRR